MPRKVFTARVGFRKLAEFSRWYMLEHSNILGLLPLPPHLVFLLESTDEQIRAGLADDTGWVDGGGMYQPLYDKSIYDNGYGNWLGYGDDVPFDFRWQSCSGAVLIARPRRWSMDEPERLYDLECRPPIGREDCGYMSLFRRLGVRFEPVQAPQSAPSWQDQDEEPNWCPIDLHTDRPESHC